MPDATLERLRINGREKLPPTAYDPDDRLYRGYSIDDLDDLDQINANSLRLPDLSCNWDRYSEPEDVRLRRFGQPTDGCYAFSVETARFDRIATPVHDPLNDAPYENYAHTEIRELLPGEPLDTEPPKQRKMKKWKARRAKWRRHVVQNLMMEIEAKA